MLLLYNDFSRSAYKEIEIACELTELEALFNRDKCKRGVAIANFFLAYVYRSIKKPVRILILT